MKEPRRVSCRHTKGFAFHSVSDGLPLEGFKACDMVTGLNFRYGNRGEDGLMKDKTLEKDNGEGGDEDLN